MISSSDHEPSAVQVDLVQDGEARVLVRYNIKGTIEHVEQDISSEKPGEMLKEKTVYKYEEKVVWVDVPTKVAATKESMQAYLSKSATDLVLSAESAPDMAVERPTQPPYPPIVNGRY